jgi:hypothetical protein
MDVFKPSLQIIYATIQLSCLFLVDLLKHDHEQTTFRLEKDLSFDDLGCLSVGSFFPIQVNSKYSRNGLKYTGDSLLIISKAKKTSFKGINAKHSNAGNVMRQTRSFFY